MPDHPSRKLPILLACVAVFGGMHCAAGLARAQEGPSPARELRVERATSPIEIDGVLDEGAWENALVVPVRWEYQPGDAIEAPVETEALVTFDEKNLYVAFRAHDPEPRKIRANLMDRDSIETFVQDDHVTFAIDTFNDERRAYQFRVNPLGVQADAFNSEVDGTEDWSFDLIWDSAGRITDEGYVVEVAVPMKQLRFPRVGDEMTWRMSFERSWPRSVRHRIAEHQRDRNRACWICHFAEVTGFDGIEAGRNVEIDPTLTLSRTDRREDFPALTRVVALTTV